MAAEGLVAAGLASSKRKQKPAKLTSQMGNSKICKIPSDGATIDCTYGSEVVGAGSQEMHRHDSKQGISQNSTKRQSSTPDCRVTHLISHTGQLAAKSSTNVVPRKRKAETQDKTKTTNSLSEDGSSGSVVELKYAVFWTSTPVSDAVAAKIKLIKDFTRKVEESMSVLERDRRNRDLVTVPELALLGAITSMRTHFEMGSQDEADLSDVEEAVVRRCQRPFGLQTSVNFVTVDILKTTKFEHAIHDKIARRGIDDVNLLEIELELNAREQMKSLGLAEEWRAPKELLAASESFLEKIKDILNSAGGDEQDDDNGASGWTEKTGRDEVEIEKNGVCVAITKDI